MSTLSPRETADLWPAFEREVRGAGRVLVGSHVNPDGDSIGSTLAMVLALDQMGVEVEAVSHDGVPRSLRFLPGSERVRCSAGEGEYGLGVILDLEAMERLGSLRPVFEGVRRRVVIDHHQPHEGAGDLRIVSVGSPATAAVLADLFKGGGLVFTPDLATCLLTGILTDTGNFRFPNTTAHALHLAAELLEAGADLRGIVENVHMTRSVAGARLLGLALERICLAEEEQIAWTSVGRGDFAATGAVEEDTEGFVNELLAIETVRMAAFFREGSSGRIKVSLRSRGALDMTVVAREFGGGGHKNASGASHDGPMEVAEREIVEAMRRCLASF